MIRSAIVFCVLATVVSAQDEGLTYHGLTLGAPLPTDVTPRSSKLNADRLNADHLPADTLDLCVHVLTPPGASSLIATSLPCNGLVMRISAGQDLFAFFRPDNTTPPITSQINAMEFGDTSLAQVRARFCSEGLVAPRWFGQMIPDNVGAFALAYDLADSDTIAAFWFQTPQRGFLPAPTRDTVPVDVRDDAVLVSVEIMTPDLFAKITSEPATPSAGYVPIPNIFDPENDVTSDCSFS